MSYIKPQALTESRLFMWRTLISFGLSEGLNMENLVKFLEPYFSRVDLSDEQKNIIEVELGAPTPIGETIPSITSPSDRGQLVSMARVLLSDYGREVSQIQASVGRLEQLALEEVDVAKAIASAHAVALEKPEAGNKRKGGLRGFLDRLKGKAS